MLIIYHKAKLGHQDLIFWNSKKARSLMRQNLAEIYLVEKIKLVKNLMIGIGKEI